MTVPALIIRKDKPKQNGVVTEKKDVNDDSKAFLTLNATFKTQPSLLELGLDLSLSSKISKHTTYCTGPLQHGH